MANGLTTLTEKYRHISPSTTNTGVRKMNNQDENAWVREFEKVEREQKQREGWDGRNDSPALTTFEYLTMITSEANNEIND